MSESSVAEARPLLKDAGFVEEKPEVKKTKPPGCRSVIRSMLLGDDNPDFALNAEISIRGAIFVCVTGLPFILPAGVCGPLDYIMRKGMYNNGVITFFVYNYSAYLGDVISAVTYGIRGTALAVLNTWIMYFVFSEGVTDDTPETVFWFGIANGAIFIFLMFFLNLSISTTIFAVSNFVFFWMDFLNTGKASWAMPFTEGFVLIENVGIQSLFTLIVGGIFCILATLFPYPMRALENATEIAEELTDQMPNMWRHIFDYFAADSPNIYVADQVHRRMARLETISGKLGTRVATAWWECLGLGRGNVRRRMLTALDTATSASYDRIKGTWVVARGETWQEPHVKMMQAIKSDVYNCTDLSADLYGKCMNATSNGVLDEAGENEIRQALAKLNSAADQLAKTFRDERNKMCDADKDKRNMSKYCMEEHLVSHMVCTNICAYVRHADTFANKLLQQRLDPGKLPMAHTHEGFKAVFAGMTSHNNVMFMLRGCTSIFTAFALGYIGYGELVGSNVAAIACTASVLQSRFLGSALVKNLGRIQGVVLGSIAGEIVRACFPTCAWYDISGLTAAVLAYAIMTLFIYHNSVQYSYLGCLLGAFGIQKMLSHPCVERSSEHFIDKTADYSYLIGVVIAVALIVLFDLLLSTSRASDKAYTATNRAYGGFEDVVRCAFDKTLPKLDFHKGSLLDDISSAEDMGAEAQNEPRYWRTAWKDPCFNECMRLFRRIRYATTALEYSLVEDGTDGASKNAVCLKLNDLREWTEMGRLLTSKMAAVKKLLPIFVHDTVNRFPALGDEDATKQFGAAADQVKASLIERIRGISDLAGSNAGSSLEKDPICQLCMIIGATTAIFDGLCNVQHAILRV